MNACTGSHQCAIGTFINRKKFSPKVHVSRIPLPIIPNHYGAADNINERNGRVVAGSFMSELWHPVRWCPGDAQHLFCITHYGISGCLAASKRI